MGETPVTHDVEGPDLALYVGGEVRSVSPADFPAPLSPAEQAAQDGRDRTWFEETTAGMTADKRAESAEVLGMEHLL
jgi:phosphosulfolactate phosphohydrolase-like enzyme